WFYEEFGQHLSAMMKETGTHAAFRGLMRRFNECPPDYSSSTIGRGLDVVQRPYLAFLGLMTPADMRPFAKRGAALWNDGYLARFAFVTPPPGTTPNNQEFPDDQRIIPADLIKPLREWHDRLGWAHVIINDELDDNHKPTGRRVATVQPSAPVTVTLSNEARAQLYRYRNARSEEHTS